MASRSDAIDIEAPAPRANAELIGHERAERILHDAWQSGRLAHAWLITGPRGIGKSILAFRFARFALAGGVAEEEGGLALSPEHPVFRRVASGGHADLMTLERGIQEKTGKRRAEIVVDDVRRVNRFIGLTPGEGTWRVVVVDGAEEMNRSAANALLKHLEEPPPQTVFLLASHAPGRLLPTIRSRCRRLALRPLGDRDVAALLERYLPSLDAGDRAALVHLAEGSPGRAIALAERGGPALYQSLLTILEGLPAVDMRAVHGLGDRMIGREGTETFRTVTDLLTWWLAGMVRHGVRDGTPDAGPNGAREAALEHRLLARGDLAHWVEVWENLRRLFARAEAVNLDPKQVLLNAFVTLQQAAKV